MEECIDVHYNFYRDEQKGKYMYLDTLIIRGVSNRYKGLGTKTLNRLIELAKEQDCNYIYLHADTKQPQIDGFILTKWYNKFDFYSIGKKGWMEIMIKDLIDLKEMKLMNKYKVYYYEDEFTCIAETEITCEENEISKKTDEYYENNLTELDVAGAKWTKIN